MGEQAAWSVDAANELTEEQVLNFLVNTLDEEIDIDSEDIWDVLVDAEWSA